MSRRRISILGATGSVGRSTLDVLAAAGGRERYEVVALTAHRNAEGLAAAAKACGARVAAVSDPEAYPALKQALAGSGVEAAAGPEAVRAAAEIEADWVMSAIVGAAGLEPSLAAARTGATVALANKETLVCAGELFLAEMAKGGGTLLPVDSEHNAIFQVFETERAAAVEKLIVTASGGPFRAWSREQMALATREQALAHPNWSMGVKISIDSATMFNKALEVIEAARLFPVTPEQIEVLVHPQSIVHSMVAYTDGSVLAQLGAPDMRTPIAYALGWPDRIPSPSPRLDLAAIGRLEFEAPDLERFPALRLAREVLSAGGAKPAGLNAANEVAVAAFLEGRLGFLGIAEVVEAVVARVDAPTPGSLSEVLAVDAEARAVAAEQINRRASVM